MSERPVLFNEVVPGAVWPNLAVQLAMESLWHSGYLPEDIMGSISRITIEPVYPTGEVETSLRIGWRVVFYGKENPESGRTVVGPVSGSGV